LRNGELNNLYYFPNVTKIIKSRAQGGGVIRAQRVAGVGCKRNAYKLPIVYPERKRLLEKPKCKLKDNIKIDLNRNKL
jgi:hypothetical protein